MGRTVTELEVKIGADSKGLQQELKKTEGYINRGFSPRPITAFTDAVGAADGKLSMLMGSLGKLTAVTAGCFGLTAMVQGALTAGNAVYELTQTYRMNTEEAVKMSRILTLTGGDAEQAAKAIMRMDKVLMDNSTAGAQSRAVLAAYGVSMTDSTGRLLSLNVQLERLAKGYRSARAEGRGQEYIMRTLGVRGLALTKTLLEYDEAAKRTAGIKGIGIDPKEMHDVLQDIKVMKIQLQQLELTAGSALAPLVGGISHDLLPLLEGTAAWLGKHKELVGSIAVSAVRLIAAYEALKAVRRAAMTVQDIYQRIKPSSTIRMTETGALTRSQEMQIRRSVAASNARYARQRREALATARTEEMSAAESEKFVTETFTRIGLAAERSAFAIRTRMTAAFREVNAAAVENSEVVTAAGVRSAESEVAAGRAAQTAAIIKSRAATRSIAASTAAAEANLRTAATETAIGRASLAASEQVVVGKRAGTAASLQEARAVAMTGVAYTATGAKAVSAGTVSMGVLARTGGMVRNLTGMVWALAGGWMGVAAAAVAAGAYIYSAYKKDQAYRGAHTYSVKGADGRNHRMTVGEDGTVLRANDDKAYARKYKVGHVSVYKPVDDTAIRNARKAHAAALAKVKADEERSMHVDLERQMADLTRLTAGKQPGMKNVGAHKAALQPKDTSIAAQVYQILIKSGIDSRYAIGLIGSYMTESGGNTEQLRADAVNPKSGAYGIGQWLGIRKRGLAAFAKSQGLSMADYRTQALYQVHELTTDGYEREQYRKALARIRAQGITDPGALATIADRYTTRSEQTGAIQIQKARNARRFAAKIQGGVGAGPEMDLATDMAVHQQEIDRAKISLKELEDELQAAVQKHTGTAYEIEMGTVSAEVLRKKALVDKLGQTDPGIDTRKAMQLLTQYQQEETKKVTTAWRKRWQDFRMNAARAEAALMGNYNTLAEAMYRDKRARLEAERKEQLHALSQYAHDKEAELAVDKTYTVKALTLLRELDDAKRDSYKQELDFAIGRRDRKRVDSLLHSKRREQYEAWQDRGKAIQTYVKLCRESAGTTQGLMADIAARFSESLADSFGKLGTEIHSTEELVSQVGKTMIRTVMQIMAKIVAAKAAIAIFGNMPGLRQEQSPVYRMQEYLPGGILGGIGTGVLHSRIPKFATGGIVTAPTVGVIGEGHHNEAILPLNAQTFASIGAGIIRNMTGPTQVMQPVIQIINKSGVPATVTHTDMDAKMGATIYTIVMDKLMANKDGALDALRQQVGG